MADVSRRVRHESWLSRLTGSIKSVLTGVLLVCAALPAMWCNEGRAVTTARSLEEGQGAVIRVASDAVDPANEGRLVHLTGRADTAETLRDPDFGVSASAIKLVRTTEMYQWQEYEKSETRDKDGGGKETVTTYSYSQTWSEKAIDSKAFRQSWGHDNPGPLPFPSTAFVARTVTLGAFTLSGPLVEEMKEREPLPVTKAMASALPPSTRMRLVGDGFYRGLEPASPRIGDVRVRFGVVRPQTVSVVAGQSKASFAPYQTRAGDALLMLEPGPRSAESMFRSAAVVNRVLTWILRAVGFVFVFGGVLLVFRPIAVLGSVVPLFGSLLEAGLWLFSVGIAAALALVTIAAAWFFYRPLFALGLLLATAATLLWLRWRGARRRSDGHA
jgi:hypothetical protein